VEPAPIEEDGLAETAPVDPEGLASVGSAGEESAVTIPGFERPEGWGSFTEEQKEQEIARYYAANSRAQTEEDNELIRNGKLFNKFFQKDEEGRLTREYLASITGLADELKGTASRPELTQAASPSVPDPVIPDDIDPYNKDQLRAAIEQAAEAKVKAVVDPIVQQYQQDRQRDADRRVLAEWDSFCVQHKDADNFRIEVDGLMRRGYTMEDAYIVSKAKATAQRLNVPPAVAATPQQPVQTNVPPTQGQPSIPTATSTPVGEGDIEITPGMSTLDICKAQAAAGDPEAIRALKEYESL
jgi:hypothetical protein